MKYLTGKRLWWALWGFALAQLVYIIVWGGGFTKAEIIRGLFTGAVFWVGRDIGYRQGRRAKSVVDAAWAKRLSHVLNGGEDTGEGDISIKLVDPEPPTGGCCGGARAEEIEHPGYHVGGDDGE